MKKYINRHSIYSVVLIVGLLLLAGKVLLVLNPIEVSKQDVKRELEMANSYGLSTQKTDSVFAQIQAIVETHHKEITNKSLIDSMVRRVRVAERRAMLASGAIPERMLSYTTASNSMYVPATKLSYIRNPHKITFYLVAPAGYIADIHGTVAYYLPGYANKYYYELELNEGIYSFQTLTNRDTIPFVVDSIGVYKLGFQELHPNFLVFKDSLP